MMRIQLTFLFGVLIFFGVGCGRLPEPTTTAPIPAVEEHSSPIQAPVVETEGESSPNSGSPTLTGDIFQNGGDPYSTPAHIRTKRLRDLLQSAEGAEVWEIIELMEMEQTLNPDVFGSEGDHLV